jgi:hypothetical protein
MKAVDGCCPRVSFGVIKNPTPGISGHEWLVIEPSIRIWNKNRHVFIPKEQIDIVKEFLSEIVIQYTNNFASYATGNSEVVVKLDLEKILLRCRREYILYLKDKHEERKEAIRYLRSRRLLKNVKIVRFHSAKTYSKIDNIIRRKNENNR